MTIRIEGWTMGDKVTISYRGATYELGRGKRFYGIWAAGAPRTEPVERWPDTPDGWAAAWTRFTAMETPGTIAPAGQQQGPGQSAPDPFSGPGDYTRPDAFSFSGPAGYSGPAGAGETLTFGRQAESSRRIMPGGVGTAFAAALLGIGVLCGVVGLFPHYQAGVSLASTPANLVPHVAYLAVWTLAALLIVLRAGTLTRAGALLAVGTSVITSGLFLADLGQGLSVADAGLWISLVGWLACTTGAALAFLTTSPGIVAKPGSRSFAKVALLIVAGVGVAVTFFPNWDSYLLRFAAIGRTEMVGAGYAFAPTLPGWVQAADVIVMVLFVLLVVAAALWRPLVGGAMLLAGAAIPMAAEAVSAMIQQTEATSPLIFGITASQAQQYGLTITNGLTPAFWVYCLFVVTLLVSCAWMLMSPPDRPEAGSVPVPAAGPATEPVPESATGPATGPVTESAPEPVTTPVPESADGTWTERELTADSRDDRA
jgi:hypothetical protein